jgi:methionine--tRNA ligase beta chain
MITIEDFKKIDLRIGKIEQAEKIENTKLVVLKVNLGNEIKNIVAGIGNKYSIEELIGQLVVVVVNLEPKEIKGVKSEGMILAANAPEGPVLIVPLEQVFPGTQVR